MKAQFQIAIPKRSKACVHCKAPFTEGLEIQSQVIEEGGEWIREDSCIFCFSPIKTAATWKHIIGTEEKVLPEQRDHIESSLDLLQKLIESELPSDHEEAFLLALYLVRKKVLVHRAKMGLYENVETGELFLVPKIDFSHFSAYAVQLRLQEKI